MPAAKKPKNPGLTVAYVAAGQRAPGARAIPDGISHQAAQAELSAALFPDYLLGRQLALEEAVRELFLLLPEDQRQAARERLRFHADEAMERLQTAPEGARQDATDCGYVCALLQQGA